MNITKGTEAQIKLAVKIASHKNFSSLFADMAEQLEETGGARAVIASAAMASAASDAKFWIDMQEGFAGTTSVAVMIEKFVMTGEVGTKTANVTGYTFQEYLRAADLAAKQ